MYRIQSANQQRECFIRFDFRMQSGREDNALSHRAGAHENPARKLFEIH
jgi:hypothetical protein